MSSPLPRVTHILEAVGLGPTFEFVDAATLEAARVRGSDVHAAIEADCYGYLDEADLPPAAAPYVSAYRKFRAESGFEPIAAEVVVEHPSWRYQGHPDVIGWLNGHRVLIDAKTGETDGAEYQVALYVLAWNAQHPDQRVTAGAILSLREDGTYRFQEVELPRAEPVALAALVVYGAQAR